MGDDKHTRKQYAYEHRHSIESIDGVWDVEIIEHSDDWNSITYDFHAYEPDDVYEDITDWFMTESDPTKFDAIHTPEDEFDGQYGTFTIFINW